MTDRLRAAAEAALEAITELEYSNSTAVADKIARDAKQQLRAALAEREAASEPFVWYDDDTGETWTPGAVQDGGAPDGLRPLYAAPIKQDAPEVGFGNMEPVAWMKNDGAITTDAYEASCWRDRYSVVNLYTAPPRRQWVGLTEEEMYELVDLYRWHDADCERLDVDGCVRAIEAALKERNA